MYDAYLGLVIVLMCVCTVCVFVLG